MRSEFKQNLVNALTSKEEANRSQLALLSDLTEEEAAFFEREWNRASRDRKLYLLSGLVKLREDSLYLDFNRVFHVCLGDKDAEIRRVAIKFMDREEDDESVVTKLVHLLKEDREEKVQVEAAIALGQFALLAAVNKLSPPRGEEIYSNLLAAIEDITVAEDVRRRCLEAIAPLDSPRVKQIIEQAYHSNDGETQASAICAMGRNCDPVWLSIMSVERYSKDPVMRRKVAEAYGELGREEAIPFLIDLAWDEESEVREVSVRALGLIGGERAEGALKNLGDSPYQGVSQLARDTLKEMEKFVGFFDI